MLGMQRRRRRYSPGRVPVPVLGPLNGGGSRNRNRGVRLDLLRRCLLMRLLHYQLMLLLVISDLLLLLTIREARLIIVRHHVGDVAEVRYCVRGLSRDDVVTERRHVGSANWT